jgi:hypothetical protein
MHKKIDQLKERQEICAKRPLAAPILAALSSHCAKEAEPGP